MLLFKTNRRVYCSGCCNKKTIGCYHCNHFLRFYDYDHCSEGKYKQKTPIYCEAYSYTPESKNVDPEKCGINCLNCKGLITQEVKIRND